LLSKALAVLVPSIAISYEAYAFVLTCVWLLHVRVWHQRSREGRSCSCVLLRITPSRPGLASCRR